MEAVIFDIQHCSFVDGPGIRTTVFFKGCNLRCKWCHSPESQNIKKQLMYYKDRCTHCNACIEICPFKTQKCILCSKCTDVCLNNARETVGKTYTADEILNEVLKDKVFYDTSGGGVTFSGGECMLQSDFLKKALSYCKENGIHTAIDTAGNVPWKIFEKILPFTDLFLYDIKCISESLHIEGTGVSNKLILDNFTKLAKNFSGDIIVRIPVIKGFNSDYEEMKKISEFLKDKRVKKVELLPYHAMGESKYKALNMEFTRFEVPQNINELKNLFKKE